MSKDFYNTLWIEKKANASEIKKAYRKKAMQYHPDKNKGDKTAEAKFKEVNEAYQTLSNPKKKQQYDTFGSTSWTWWNPFWGGWWASWFWGFEDIFGGMWGWKWRSQSQSFNMEDLFWNQHQAREEPKKEPVSLDFTKTYEVPIFDLILGCSIEVRGVYGQTKNIKIPAKTKPWTKMRVKEFGKSEGVKKWNLLITIEAKMPKSISEVDMMMLERIRDWVGY